MTKMKTIKQYLTWVQYQCKKRTRGSENNREIRKRLVNQCSIHTTRLEYKLNLEQTRVNEILKCKFKLKSKPLEKKSKKRPLMSEDMTTFIKNQSSQNVLSCTNSELLHRMLEHHKIVVPDDYTSAKQLARLLYVAVYEKIIKTKNKSIDVKPVLPNIIEVKSTEIENIVFAARTMGIFKIVDFYETKIQENENYWQNDNAFPTEMANSVVRARARTPSRYELFQKEIPGQFQKYATNLLPMPSDVVWKNNKNECKVAYAKRRFHIENSTMKLSVCGVCNEHDISMGLFNDFKSSMYDHNTTKRKFVFYNENNRMYSYLTNVPHVKTPANMLKIEHCCQRCIGDIRDGHQPRFDQRQTHNEGIKPLPWMNEMTWAEVACCKCRCWIVFLYEINLLMRSERD